MICEAGLGAEQVLGTLGQTETPQSIVDLAAQIRNKLCKHYNTSPRDGKLRGGLIDAMAKEMQDPDDEAVRWIRDECTPLGIECPILPRRVFPESTTDDLEEEHHEQSDQDNYASSKNAATKLRC